MSEEHPVPRSRRRLSATTEAVTQICTKTTEALVAMETTEAHRHHLHHGEGDHRGTPPPVETLEAVFLQRYVKIGI